MYYKLVNHVIGIVNSLFPTYHKKQKENEKKNMVAVYNYILSTMPEVKEESNS